MYMPKKQTVLLSLIALSIFVFRSLPHAPNFTPVLALFIVAGYIGQRSTLSFLLPAVAMVASDLLLGTYSSFLFVYAPLFLAVFSSRIWGRSSLSVFGSGVISAILFFLVSNFGVWYMGELPYSRDFQGLLHCYEMALPFFRTTLSSTLFWLASIQVVRVMSSRFYSEQVA